MGHIQDLIDYFGGTEKALAEAIGVSQPTVHAWKTGKHGVSLEKALRIERLTNGRFPVESFCHVSKPAKAG